MKFYNIIITLSLSARAGGIGRKMMGVPFLGKEEIPRYEQASMVCPPAAASSEGAIDVRT